METLGFIASLFMGLSLGLIGGGGAILTVPVLVYLFKMDALSATTSSLFVVGTTALLGAALNARQGFVDFKTGVLFALPSSAGVYFARKVLLPFLPDQSVLPGGFMIAKSGLILLSFAVLMIFASRAMIRSAPVQPDDNRAPHGLSGVGLKGFFVGCATGFVGAGGGFLIVPALVLLLHIPMRKAIGTSLAIIAANSLFGFSVSLDPTIDWQQLLSITALGLTGLAAGHRISSRFPERILKRGFGYFVLVVGVLILVDQGVRLI